MTETNKRPTVTKEALRQEAERKSESFRLIGAFIFQFSQLEFTIRVLLGGVLRLTNEQFDAVTAPYDFAVLCSVAKIVLANEYKDKAQEIGDIFKRCKTLNNDRVRVAHGVWSDDGTTLKARHVPRGSLTAGEFFRDPEELSRLTERARELMGELFEFS